MRALRDFNTPKIPLHDRPVFLRLVSDVFMGCEVAAKTNQALYDLCVEVATSKGLQKDDGFVQKVTTHCLTNNHEHGVRCIKLLICILDEIVHKRKTDRTRILNAGLPIPGTSGRPPFRDACWSGWLR